MIEETTRFLKRMLLSCMILDFNTNDSRLGWLVSEGELGEGE